MKMNFECHITLPSSCAAQAEVFAATHHWKTSQIRRDPVLGTDEFVYLTTHDSDLIRLQIKMKDAVVSLERLPGVHVLRQKIELIVFDTRANG